ncbi:MAG: class I SAM-dependent methyltransferase [Carnobacterium sp.]|uniref:class I SAM-dependent methyltransferase n=1 Tax=Carnobacterium sp. TaxID=48221 RepID=UPI003315D071
MKQCSVLPQDILIAGAIFNLGYLPNEEKTIIPTSETTLITIIEILPRLRKGGLLLLVVYSGHIGGKEEKDTILTYVQTLSQTDYTVLRYDFLNKKKPPLLIAIEKNKKRNGGWPSFLLISI